MIVVPKIIATYRGIECNEFFNSMGKIFSLGELIEIKNDFIIVVDFSIVKFSIIEHIIKCGKYHLKESKNDKSMSYDIKSNYIKIYNTDKKVLILCSYENKFMQDFENFEIANALELMDIEKQTTCTKDAKKQFMATITRQKNYFAQTRIFDKIFPQFDDKEFFYNNACKKSVCALFYCNVGEFENIYSYDIKSSFPSRVYGDFFPNGEGRYFDDIKKVPYNKWYVCKIKIYSFSVKLFDFLDFCSMADEYGEITYYTTKEMLEFIEICYDCDYDIIDGYFYTLQRSIFDKFLNSNFLNELNKNKNFRKYNKAKNNLLFGNFGRNTKINNVVFGVDEDKLTQKIEKVEIDDKGYYPLYLYVNGKSKLEILKIVKDNFENILYINTDGFFSKNKMSFMFYNLGKENNIGTVEFRDYYKKICIKDISNYFAFSIDCDGVICNDFRLSGRKTNVDDYNDFISGNFYSLYCRLTPYGFLNFIEEKEKPLSFYIEYKQYLDNIMKLQRYGFLSIKNREKFIMLKEDLKMEKDLKELEKIYNSIESGKLEEVTDIFTIRDLSIKIYKCKIDFSCGNKRYKKYDILTENEVDKKTIKDLLNKKYIKEV